MFHFRERDNDPRTGDLLRIEWNQVNKKLPAMPSPYIRYFGEAKHGVFASHAHASQ